MTIMIFHDNSATILTVFNAIVLTPWTWT